MTYRVDLLLYIDPYGQYNFIRQWVLVPAMMWIYSKKCSVNTFHTAMRHADSDLKLTFLASYSVSYVYNSFSVIEGAVLRSPVSRTRYDTAYDLKDYFWYTSLRTRYHEVRGAGTRYGVRGDERRETRRRGDEFFFWFHRITVLYIFSPNVTCIVASFADCGETRDLEISNEILFTVPRASYLYHTSYPSPAHAHATAKALSYAQRRGSGPLLRVLPLGQRVSRTSESRARFNTVTVVTVSNYHLKKQKQQSSE